MNKKVICFGEVLFDIFPTHQKIGGAPLNVALRLSSLGLESHIISRIGNDERGRELLAFIENKGIDRSTIQLDHTLNTGEVIVKLNEQGSASYTINYPVAWDKIEFLPEDQNLVQNADALVFGSLACRDSASRQTLLQLIENSRFSVFDVNLRAPFYSKELLIHLMTLSDFIKFNDDELYEIARFMKSPYHSLEQNIIFIAEKTNTNHICVTKGRHGAVLFQNSTMFYNSGYNVDVIDTVGSGDSFLAGLLFMLLNKKHPQEAIDFSCALGALVAKNSGANPIISSAEINLFINPKL